MGVNGSGRKVGVHRTSYPSGPWVDANGNPARSPNEVSYSTPSLAEGYKPNSTIENPNSNPNPANYEIIDHTQVGDFLILKIRYPDCTNYEGVKILVYHKVSPIDLLKQKLIDPHFFKHEKFKSPIARFVPTIEGWNMAVRLARFETDNHKRK